MGFSVILNCNSGRELEISEIASAETVSFAEHEQSLSYDCRNHYACFMRIRITFPCPTCDGTNLRASHSGSSAIKKIAAFFFLKPVRCRECGARHYFPSFLPDRRS